MKYCEIAFGFGNCLGLGEDLLCCVCQDYCVTGVGWAAVLAAVLAAKNTWFYRMF